MTAHNIAENALLAFVVLTCWIGAIGMWRMPQPTQALQFLSLPATVGAIALAFAVLLADGPNQAFWKTLFIAFVLFCINSIGAHATARAFRTRDLGHWEPLDGDPIEFVRDFTGKDPKFSRKPTSTEAP